MYGICDRSRGNIRDYLTFEAARALHPRRDDRLGLHAPAQLSDIGPLFDPADTIAIANSLFTDNYLFGEFTVAKHRFRHPCLPV